LADEATSALDPETTQEVLALLRRVNAELGTTIIVITHEMEVIRTTAQRVAVLDAGRIVEEGDVYDIFARPQHPLTRRYVGTVVHQTPDVETLARLRARHTGRLVQVALCEDDLSQQDLFSRLVGAGVGVELVHGGIEDIQGRTFGQLILALSGPGATIDDALADLRGRVDLVPLPEAELQAVLV
jgi:D-methionine transport system ATP-binding protein